MKKTVNAFVDGSFDEKSSRYGWAFVIVDGNGNIVVKENGVGTNADAATTRNVAGELSAAMRAAHWAAKNGVAIRLHHDYLGVAAWVIGSWKAKNPITQAYREFMDKYYKKGVIEFVHVKGHSGIIGNELADKLAREALGK